MWTILPATLRNVLESSLYITGLVILMMAVLELINVSSSGQLMKKLHRYPAAQLLVACLLGVTPGCAGGFAVVSMFTHGLISFGALMGGMVATFGDEAFWLFAKSPKWGAVLSVILFILGIITGLTLDFVNKKWHFAIESHEFQIHDLNCTNEYPHSDNKTHQNKIVHFIKEHLWNHVIKQHFLTVFLWTFGVLFLLRILDFYIDLNALMRSHEWAKYLLLLLAVAIGFIPESGPHLIFVIMFLEGTIPFGILLANSIAQNGHAGLPLIAQSRKNFFIMKIITMGLGLLIGAVAIL